MKFRDVLPGQRFNLTWRIKRGSLKDMSNQEQTSYTLEELARESGIETRVIRSFIENGLLRGPGKLGRYARYSRHHLSRLLAIKVMKETQGMRLSEVRQQLLFMSEAEIIELAKTRVTTPNAGGSGPTSALDYIRAHNQVFFDQAKANYRDTRPPDRNFDHEVDDLDVSIASHEEDEQEQSPISLANSIRAKLKAMSQTVGPRNKSEAQSETARTDQEAKVSEENSERLTGWGPAPREDGTATYVTQAKPIDRLVDGLRLLAGEKSVRRQSKSEQWHHIQITPDIELSVRGVPDEQQLARLECVADYLRELLTGAGYE